MAAQCVANHSPGRVRCQTAARRGHRCPTRWPGAWSCCLPGACALGSAGCRRLAQQAAAARRRLGARQAGRAQGPGRRRAAGARAGGRAGRPGGAPPAERRAPERRRRRRRRLRVRCWPQALLSGVSGGPISCGSIALATDEVCRHCAQHSRSSTARRGLAALPCLSAGHARGPAGGPFHANQWRPPAQRRRGRRRRDRALGPELGDGIPADARGGRASAAQAAAPDADCGAGRRARREQRSGSAGRAGAQRRPCAPGRLAAGRHARRSCACLLPGDRARPGPCSRGARRQEGAAHRRQHHPQSGVWEQRGHGGERVRRAQRRRRGYRDAAQRPRTRGDARDRRGPCSRIVVPLLEPMQGHADRAVCTLVDSESTLRGKPLWHRSWDGLTYNSRQVAT